MQNSLQARFENQLGKFVIDFKRLLNSRVVQMSEALMNDFYRRGLLNSWAFDLKIRRPRVELAAAVVTACASVRGATLALAAHL